MSKEQDRNASTNLMLRGFNVELLEKLKTFTGEKTGAKAIILVCARYLSLEKLCDKQKETIENYKFIDERLKKAYKRKLEAEQFIHSILSDSETELDSESIAKVNEFLFKAG